MKKHLKLFILIFICFLPVMVDAKANFTFKSEYMNELFLFKNEENKYYFINPYKYFNEAGSIVIYDEEDEIIGSDRFSDEENYTQQTIIDSDYFEPYYNMFIKTDGTAYDEENKLLMYVDYGYELFSYYDYEQNQTVEIGFNDNLNYTKEILGDRYDLYLYLKNFDIYISNIEECNDYFILYYEDQNEDDYISILDSEFKFILTFENTILGEAVYIYDDLIYMMEADNTVAVYKLDGTKAETLTIDNDVVNENDDNGYCDNYYPELIYIENNEFYIMYELYQCEERIVNYESGHSDLATVTLPNYYTFKYNLSYDIETVESSNGEFTYETKEDEDGRSYVELKITPKDGYSVKEIIVTDVNGNRVEVTNNKFYKPLNDVKIEVQYVLGEYLPIPDTFLGKSVTLIVIGLILVGLGIYTINYVRGESKVDI